MKYLSTLTIVTIVFLSACSGGGQQTENETTKDVAPAEDNSAKTVAADEDFNTIELGDVKMKVPYNWISEPVTSNMRIAQFRLDNNEAIELVLFYFGEAVGTEAANVERWKNEYETLDDFSEKTMKKSGVTVVTAKGTYKKKASMRSEEYTAIPGSITVAAIIPTAQGPYYFKVVGPQEEIAAEKKSILTFLRSYRKVEKSTAE